MEIFRSTAREKARTTLIDLTLHTDVELDAAAAVLARSDRQEDKRLAADWQEVRRIGAAR